MGEESFQCANICYIVELDGIRFLHLGDAEINYDYLKKMLLGEDINIAFINFPYVQIPKGKRIIREVIKPEYMIVFHLPFEEDDKNNYIKNTLKRYEREIENFPATEIFIKEGEKVEYIY